MIEMPLPGEDGMSIQMLPGFAEDQAGKGAYVEIKTDLPDSKEPQLFYTHPHGEIWVGDALSWLKSLATASVDLIFADPPYNVKKAEWDNFESQQEYIAWSLQWISEAARVLKSTGTLYICGYSEILSDLKLPASRFSRAAGGWYGITKTKPISVQIGDALTKVFCTLERAINLLSISMMSESHTEIIP